MAVLYVKKQDGKLEELGRTEVVQNSLNPQWITKISINYQFEMVQSLVYALFVLIFICILILSSMLMGGIIFNIKILAHGNCFMIWLGSGNANKKVI